MRTQIYTTKEIAFYKDYKIKRTGGTRWHYKYSVSGGGTKIQGFRFIHECENFINQIMKQKQCQTQKN